MKICIPDLSRIGESAREFLSLYPQGGVFGLSGDLGVGKTTWVKAVIAELCQRSGDPMPRVTSPSFVIHQSYSIQPPVDHFDFYRLTITTASALIEIGFWEAVDKARLKHGYVFVEWPEKASGQPLDMTAGLSFSFDPVDPSCRWVNLSG